MRFLINTPQTVGHHVAMQEARQAHRRQSSYRSEMESAAKKQKLIHGFMPSAPAQSQTYATTNLKPIGKMPKSLDACSPPAQAQAHNATDLGPATGRPKLADTSLPPAQVQAQDLTDLGPHAKKRKADHCSITPTKAHEDEETDVEPTTKKPRLSYASLPPARVRHRTPSVENAHIYTECYRKRYRRLCELHGYDYRLLDPSILPDPLSLSPAFNLHEHMAAQGSEATSDAYGSPELDVHPLDEPSAEGLMSKSPKVDAHLVSEQKSSDLSDDSPAPDTVAQVCPVSREVTHPCTSTEGPISEEHPSSGHGTSDPLSLQGTTPKASLAIDGKLSEAYPPLGDQTSTSLSSINSESKIQPCSSSAPDEGLTTTLASSDPVASFGLYRETRDETEATSSDHVAPLPLEFHLRDDTESGSPFRNSSADPPRNRGGRPRGRRPRALKTPKGPTRFQKNHPVKATVNIDVWENILLYCPPDFLLKARKISPTFRSVLKDDSLIWKRARINHFGPDMPDPPAGLSEPQYADLLTGTGCQTHGCESKKTRKTYWAFQRRLCIECFQKAFLPPRALKRVFTELERSETPQYRSIAQYYQHMEQFLPGMKFDRWDNYQWLGDYFTTPSWGQLYRSGQYTGYPAAAYANFSSELANLIGNEYDVEYGRFSSSEPMHGKTCPPQDVIDAWFDVKRAANDGLMPELQVVENWCESYKRDNQKVGKDLRKNRENFYEEQAELAGWDKAGLHAFKSYQAAIAISKPATIQSWKILQPKMIAEKAEQEMKAGREAEREAERAAEREAEREAEPAIDWDDDIMAAYGGEACATQLTADNIFSSVWL